MLRGLFIAVVIVLALPVLVRHSAEAKMPSYVITGGELGPYAAVFSAWDDQFPSLQNPLVNRPDQNPSLHYDVYSSAGAALAQRVANGAGPEMRYYPNLTLLEYLPSASLPEAWYRLAPGPMAVLDNAVADALDKRARGELEIGPVAAFFRSQHLDEMSYWLRPASVTESPGYEVPMACLNFVECVHLGPSTQDFNMRDLIETVSGPPRTAAGPPPVYVIEGYVGIGNGGISGQLGFYTPLADGQPGRFWFGGYSADAPYYETTLGFDAVIAQALDVAAKEADARPSAHSEQSTAVSANRGQEGVIFWLGIAGAAVLLTALVGGCAAVYARRGQARRFGPPSAS